MKENYMLCCDLYLVFRNSTIMSVYHHFLKNKTVNVVPLIQYTDFTKVSFSLILMNFHATFVNIISVTPLWKV